MSYDKRIFRDKFFYFGRSTPVYINPIEYTIETENLWSLRLIVQFLRLGEFQLCLVDKRQETGVSDKKKIVSDQGVL